MCGRIAFFAAGHEPAERFQLSKLPQFQRRYNIDLSLPPPLYPCANRPITSHTED
jgi:hypothetical protein